MKITASLHKRVNRLWSKRSLAAACLWPLSLLYGAAVGLRRAAYRSGLLRSVDAGVPVIVVGNISVGGTGKTPVVAWLAEQLRMRGYRPAIVSRGYGGAEPREPVVVDAASRVEVVGDEPALLYRLTGVPVVVCKDRVAAARVAASLHADIVISDDGLQHYRLQRAAEIAVVDAQRGHGNGWLLPAGPLREPPGRLGSVDVILANGGETNRAEGVVGFRLRQDDPVSLANGQTKALTDFREVWSVAGIGNPGRFHNSLRAAGLSVHEAEVRDHGKVNLAALRARKDIPIVMTEKDAVKYELAEAVSAWYVPVKLEMHAVDAAAVLNEVLARLRPRANAEAAAG